MSQGNPYQRIRETNPKSLGNNLKEVVNKDLRYISQIFHPKMTGKQSHALRLDVHDCSLKK